MKKAVFGICALFLFYLMIGNVSAAIITETFDAGQTMSTAMILGTGTTQVNGNLGFRYDVDLYKFYVGSAQTYDIYMGNSIGIDDNLILFNGNGQGLHGNDDGGGDKESLISRHLDIGWYFLAAGDNNIVGCDADNNQIITNDSGSLSAPTSGILDHFIMNGTDQGDYTITFLPTTGNSGNPVPEPATMLFFGAGLLGLAGMHRKKN